MARKEGGALPFVAPGALLMTALLVYFTEGRTLAALLPAVLIHEAGHLLALRLAGLRFRALRPEMTGLRIDYAGDGGAAGELLAAAAGPAAGFIYAWASSRLAGRFGWDTLSLSAELSLLLSLFNLLPAQPLDGGCVVTVLFSLWPGGKKGERAARLISLVTAISLCAAGLWFMLRQRGAAMLLAGGALLAEQRKAWGGGAA